MKDQIGAVRRQLLEQTVFGTDRQMLVALAAAYLDRSAQAERNKKQRFLAERLLSSAAALEQAIDFSQRLPDTRSAPSREQAGERLEAVYFRTQQADYFLERSDETSAKPLPDLARRWYQKALQFLETDPGTSANYGAAAAQLVSALECLAQANASLAGSGKK